MWIHIVLCTKKLETIQKKKNGNLIIKYRRILLAMPTISLIGGNENNETCFKRVKIKIERKNYVRT